MAEKDYKKEIAKIYIKAWKVDRTLTSPTALRIKTMQDALNDTGHNFTVEKLRNVFEILDGLEELGYLDVEQW